MTEPSNYWEFWSLVAGKKVDNALDFYQQLFIGDTAHPMPGTHCVSLVRDNNGGDIQLVANFYKNGLAIKHLTTPVKIFIDTNYYPNTDLIKKSCYQKGGTKGFRLWRQAQAEIKIRQSAKFYTFKDLSNTTLKIHDAGRWLEDSDGQILTKKSNGLEPHQWHTIAEPLKLNEFDNLLKHLTEGNHLPYLHWQEMDWEAWGK